MANVLNRVTRKYLRSANTPDFPVADWIINPDVSAVIDQPIKYWVISGDTVSLMSQADRDDVDADIEDARKDVREAEFGDDPFAETVRQLINQERAARGASVLTPAAYRANFRSNL